MLLSWWCRAQVDPLRWCFPGWTWLFLTQGLRSRNICAVIYTSWHETISLTYDLIPGDGFKYLLFSPRSLGFHDPIWLAHIFQMRGSTTNSLYVSSKIPRFHGRFWCKRRLLGQAYEGHGEDVFSAAACADHPWFWHCWGGRSCIVSATVQWYLIDWDVQWLLGCFDWLRWLLYRKIVLTLTSRRGGSMYLM